MKSALLDVNVLVALFDPAHPDHEDAHAWFARSRRHGWATCPLTINGCARVLSNPGYPTVEATTSEVLERLKALTASPEHQFWADDVSLLDTSVFRAQAIAGHRQITDVYLLGLAVHHGGRLATFDASIPIRSVVGAKPDCLEVIRPTAKKQPN